MINLSPKAVYVDMNIHKDVNVDKDFKDIAQDNKYNSWALPFIIKIFIFLVICKVTII